MIPAYCNTSYDLQQWAPTMNRMFLSEEQSGADGEFASGSQSFVAASAVFTMYEANDTLLIPEREANQGVFHIESVVSDSVLILNRTAVTSMTDISWMATKLINRMAQSASDDVNDSLADMSHIISVPFDRTLFQSSIADMTFLDESIPISLAGHLLSVTLTGASYPTLVTLTGKGEHLDWRNRTVEQIFTTDNTKRPILDDKTQTETLTHSDASTVTTTKKWRSISDIDADTGTGTLTVKLTIPRQVRRLTALETVIQLVNGNYLQGSLNQTEWVEQLMKRRDDIYSDYRTGFKKLSELTESTIQRGRARSVRIVRN